MVEEGTVISNLWDRLDPGFLDPIWLLVGLLAIVAVVLLEIGAWRRRKQAVRLFAASHLLAALTASVSSHKRLLKRILLIAAVGLLFTAMARPHLLFDWQEENRTGLDILFAVDCSKSMLTEDAKPNRIERAKLAISDFADQLPNNRLGLIAFAGDAFLQTPLTLDHDAFQTAVRELDTDTIPRPGTDIATAIDLAVDALKSQPNNAKFMILVTDGEDLEGRVLDAARIAAQTGLKIYTVGVGTPDGDLIPERDDSGAIQYHHDAEGNIVRSKLDEATLRQIASITGGAYVPLGQRGEGLEEIYNRYVAQLPKQNFEEKRTKIPIERFEWPLALAILFLMWEFLTNERARSAMTTPASPAAPERRPRRRRNGAEAVTATSVIAAGLLILGAPVPARALDAATGERDYKSGEYEEALDNYRQAATDQPDRSELEYNRGDAAYKSGQYLEAEEAYRKALETPDLNLQEQAYYNLGNSQFRHGEALQQVDPKKTIDMWEQALHSYESALKLKTAADTRHNYEVVKKRLEQLKQQQQQQQQQQQGSSQSNQNQQSSSGSQSQQDQNGSNGKNQQNQSGQDKENNPSSGSQNQNQSGSPNQDKNGETSGGKDKDAQMRAYSQSRTQDQQDPKIRSREEAEALLDSLKDDEHQINARIMNGDTEPPPPASGKDW